MYEPGIHGSKIGGNAANLPFSDSSFKAAIATCSIEHFKNDLDILFMKEMERILARGGKIVVAPLYLHLRVVVRPTLNTQFLETYRLMMMQLYIVQTVGEIDMRDFIPHNLSQEIN